MKKLCLLSTTCANNFALYAIALRAAFKRQSTHWAVTISLGLASSMLVLVPASAATVNYFDDTFVNTDWTIIDYEIGGGGVSSATQVLSGGNPGAYREVTTTIPSGSNERRVFSFNFLSGATYNPQSQAAISSIDYSEDSIMFSGGQTVGMAIRQDGNLYAVQIVSTLRVPSSKGFSFGSWLTIHRPILG
jgi:hypothetical protein